MVAGHSLGSVGGLVKGHGTENDFLILADLDGRMALSSSAVRALCDRHSGVGADGVLRVVRTELANEPDVAAQADEAPFFMDYRNADGSIAEMCGNGVRVFARYLRQTGLIDGDTKVATRGGTRSVRFDGESVSVDMGPAVFRPERPTVVLADGQSVTAIAAVDMPNPHVVVELPDDESLAALDLSSVPSVSPALPEGQNVEYIVRVGPHALAMRVHERGVGETRSCGTGICAAVVAAAGAVRDSATWTVDVPGGRCEVSFSEAGTVILSGPAVLVAEVELCAEWLPTHR
ncbi:diaminopimelate epimerase [Jatrophihabitans telluris]|uniref:Diaminopimelate epimerase n=1 Tax=Jatrophihabitans telluris TaxID=2038343 RepID=A0ABY4QTD6_9ACTN|nr:diaminopimelate epimerase [Jatrophihabitans telluris]UQX86738.1 diaminopimelate epimerase [Jatrophihabitans telluris]